MTSGEVDLTHAATPWCTTTGVPGVAYLDRQESVDQSPALPGAPSGLPAPVAVAVVTLRTGQHAPSPGQLVPWAEG